jgi:hypothetical protein
MRSLALFLLLAGTTALAFELKRVTVAQLEQEVNAMQGMPDAKAARQLADLQLTERLSTANLAQLQTQTPGSDARQALLLLADTSTFLHLPPAEVPQAPPPDFATQQRILTQAIHYVARTVRQLPNFSASRVTTRFEDMPQPAMQGTTTHTTYSYQPFHLAGAFNFPVVFRDGQEVIGAAGKGKKNEPAINGLTTKGEFGPILFTVLLDIAHNKIKWDHWEQAPNKTLAVFAFSVPQEQSHYQVGACCLPNDRSHASQQFPGYHGQIAVDPADGTVFRIVVQADLKPADAISRADIAVEYGPVEIGGRPYICPLRSVAILVNNTVPTPPTQSLRSPRLPPAITSQLQTQTQVDDVAFTQYHLFRAESRMIIEGTSDQQEAPGSSGPAANPVETPR